MADIEAALSQSATNQCKHPLGDRSGSREGGPDNGDDHENDEHDTFFSTVFALPRTTGGDKYAHYRIHVPAPESSSSPRVSASVYTSYDTPRNPKRPRLNGPGLEFMTPPQTTRGVGYGDSSYGGVRVTMKWACLRVRLKVKDDGRRATIWIKALLTATLPS